MHKLFFFFFCLFLASCGIQPTDDVATVKGTGEYMNSVYVSKQTKPIESAVFWAPDAKVKLEIYSDYQCPACINFHAKAEERLWTDYIDTNKITVTFKNFPLTVVHKNAEGDALAGFCALADGNFRAFHKAMYELEDVKRWNTITDEERLELAKKAGDTNPDFLKCLTEAWYQKALGDEMKDGERLGLEGTPSIYLNGALMKFSSPEEFFSIIDGAMK